ncbi:methyl-accepting chemotaxis protein [Psychrobacillus psychrodurans]|uniref:methyl-accepting chemotaxis protein n=1 Tax=Psychrobacillus psychrodurans TaxID=126157 RepID=UPI0008E9E1F3|nr:methyl-accepting chemotaxis protein [Psychrobacillus psychrodurans]MCZ8539230.1 methyl-accepting chemotaxis protein [Psychrobacillus psychrodurans]SFM34475.1 methyl-accepting chemotaxis protein [Psychrobacillus psychrodurans]
MKLTISKKLWGGFSAVLVLLIIASVMSMWTTNDVSTRYDSLIDEEMERVSLVEKVEVIQKEMSTSVLEYLMFSKLSSVEKLEADYKQVMEIITSLSKDLNNKAAIELVEKLQEQSKQLFEANTEMIELKKVNGMYQKAASQSTQLNLEISEALVELKTIEEKSASQTREELDTYVTMSNIITLLLTILSVVIGILVSHFISRSIARPIKKVTNGLAEIADGNLTIEPIVIKNRDEVGEMASTFNKMSNDLQRIVSGVRDSSMQLAANAEELSASSEESLASSQMVAKSAEAQMVASEEQVGQMNASMHSMTDLQEGVSEIASSNEDMLKATDGVRSLVTQGSSVVTNVASQMNTIHETFNETTEIMKNMAKHSNEIQNITSLITDISDQTNLLALNAAIEAARAGEYGKGFAVVAEEVRKLAEQSKNSASEIASMVQLIQSASSSAVKAITTGGEKVEEGITKTTESLNVFQQIETSVDDVVQKVESVTTAISHISEIASSVTDSVQQVQTLATHAADGASDTSAATEQQLAANEEISSSAQSLADLAEKLQNEVSHFRI